jgi:cytoplasmic tRNA 2-thiolation protein 1
LLTVCQVLRGDLPRLSRTTSIVTSTPSISTTHTSIKRSKPLKYAYEKEIVLYAHHKQLDYFSTECIYSPEAFRGSARALIKNLERVRPSAILDVVRSGEDMAKLVPGNDDGCGGCGSANGRTAGGEMAKVEQQLALNESAAEHGLEVEITTASINKVQNDAVPLKDGKKGGKNKAPPAPSRKLPKQVMGQCKICGYLSSQQICKACMLLDGLNKNRPKNKIELGYEEQEEAHRVTGATNGMEHLTVNGG